VDTELRRLSTYDWIAFTSRYAVRSVLRRLQELRLDTWTERTKIATVGSSTTRELEQAGLSVACRPAAENAASLAEAMIRDSAGGQYVLLPQGNLARPDLKEALAAAGALVRRVVVYRTVAPASIDRATLDLLSGGHIDVVIVTSPSALRNLMHMLNDDANLPATTLLACMGPTTAAAARELGLEASIVPARPDIPSLVEAITHGVIARRQREST
jgi:uroporphyrinogen III methyltransferase / synthase